MTTRKIDLTLTIHEGMTTFPVPWHPLVEITVLGRHGLEQRETRKLLLGTHTGTHCDAPRHFVPGGQTVDRLSLDTLIGPAFVLDFSSRRPSEEIDVPAFEAQVGDRRPERLIMRFDWSERLDSPSYYTDHPFISEAAAQWMVDRGLRLLAMDTPMPDNPRNGRGSARDSPNHKILLGHGIVLVEYLCNLKLLRRRDVDLTVLPLKILDGDGAPARCVAIEQES